MSRRPRSPRHWGRRAVATLALAASGTWLAACGGPSADALGHQACVDVSRSLHLYRAALAATDPARVTSLKRRALIDLRTALRPAALAGSSDGQWQALMATLSETSRVPESDLVTALSAQCAATLSSG